MPCHVRQRSAGRKIGKDKIAMTSVARGDDVLPTRGLQLVLTRLMANLLAL
jgi:hypothetical protein